MNINKKQILKNVRNLGINESDLKKIIQTVVSKTVKKAEEEQENRIKKYDKFSDSVIKTINKLHDDYRDMLEAFTKSFYIETKVKVPLFIYIENIAIGEDGKPYIELDHEDIDTTAYYIELDKLPEVKSKIDDIKKELNIFKSKVDLEFDDLRKK